MDFPSISLAVQIAAFLAFALVLARRRESTDWLFGLLLVTGLMMTVGVEQLMGRLHATDQKLLDVVNILTSGVDSYISALVGLKLMNREGFHIKASLVVTTLAQVFAYLMHGPDSSFWVYAGLDGGSCALAGTVLAVGLAQRFATSWTSAALIQLPVLTWSFADTLYWVPDTYPVLKTVGMVGMIAGFAGTAVVAVILASRQPPTLSAAPVAA